MEDILNNNQTSNVPATPSDATLQASSTPVADEYPSQPNPEDLDSRWLRWKCLNCGYVYEGVKELKKCPRCGNENPDLFEDAD